MLSLARMQAMNGFQCSPRCLRAPTALAPRRTGTMTEPIRSGRGAGCQGLASPDGSRFENGHTA